jgi:type VI secretion system secreted protein VgrG
MAAQRQNNGAGLLNGTATRCMARVMNIATPLGDDVLLFHVMQAREELSRLSEYHVDLLSDPERGEISLDDLLGQNVTISLELPDESRRHFNGFVSRIGQAGRHGRYNRFTATVMPWTWFLTRTSDYRIFQDMTVPDIVKAVFHDHPAANFKFLLNNDYRKWTYCVQYRESDFNFVSRLLEHEGISYYFRHTNGHHTMVLIDSIGRLSAVPGYEQIRFFAPGQFARPEVEYISRWEFAREVQPGVFVHTDYDPTRPKVNLRTQKTLPRNYSPSDYEVFDYPGRYAQQVDGEQYADVRIEEYGSQFEAAHADTNARGICVGSLFTLDGFQRADQNCEHVILAADYTLEFSDYEAMPNPSPPHYHCRFMAMSTEQPLRPRRVTPKPIVQGPQTAVVVGPAGDEIYTDEYGRVKVKFHWDRYGKADENSSCWIRVSQNWAGKRWGAMFLPRIGQEVIVDFLDGDPDQPIITGRVYNGESRPPYDLPRELTKSTIKSQSSKGGGGFNEIRFEDKKGSEQIFVHAERNQDNRVKHDSLEWVGNDRHLIVTRDQMEQVEGDKHLTVKGDQSERVEGTVSLEAGMDLQQKVALKHALEAGLEIHLKAGLNLVVESGTTLTLKVGGNFINLNPAGVFIQGTMVMINSGGAAGTGSGCSPAVSKAPAEADNAEPRHKAEPLLVTAATAPSTQAAVLRQAATTGVPFCEKCQETGKTREAGQR